MKIKAEHGCNNTYICGIDGKEFSSIKELEQHIEELIKSKKNALIDTINCHCGSISVLCCTNFEVLNYDVNCMIIELAKLIEEYDEVVRL